LGASKISKDESDEGLIKAIAAGSECAMRTLYARHRVRLYHFITCLVIDTGRAEDLVSEVSATSTPASTPPPVQ
jgi:DNA-directed RNA polymerase specialized sigma24 family protein